MASGHVNRTNRPNTWLHRPATRREDFPCQPGAVHTWHFMDMTTVFGDVRLYGQSEHSEVRWQGPLVTHMYGPAVRCKWILPSWR